MNRVLFLLCFALLGLTQGNENDINLNSIRGSSPSENLYKNFTLPSISAPDLDEESKDTESEDGDYSSNLDSLDPEGAIPIHKSVISYLSVTLEDEECYNLCNFLTLQTENATETQFELGCELIQTDLGITIIPEDFKCKVFLRKWNEVVMPRVLDNNADNLFYARGILEVGLIKIDRQDLSNYVKEYYGAQIKSEVSKFNKVLLGRRTPGQSRLSFTHFHLSTTEEGEAQELQLTWTQWIWNYYLQIGLSIGIFIVGIMLNCVILFASSKINPKKKEAWGDLEVDDEKQHLLV